MVLKQVVRTLPICSGIKKKESVVNQGNELEGNQQEKL